MAEINLKPITVNQCWVGKRFKTPEYKQWREQMCWLLKGKEKIKGWFGIEIEFYIKSFAITDGDNLEKPFLDALTESGIIQDDRYMKWHRSEKFPVKDKKDERVVFKIIPLAS